MKILQDRLLLRMKEVSQILGLPITTIQHLQKYEGFPQCIKLGKRTVAIKSEELNQWIEQRQRVSVG